MHFWRGRRAIDEAAYTDLREFFADLGVVYREEISALAAMGATWIQLDEVPLAMLCDPSVQARIATEGDSAKQLIDAYIESFNEALANRPEGVVIAVHLCRGNYKGRYLSEGGYEPLAERLFNEIPVDRFLLEYDTPRAGDFAPLRFVPANKTVVLGLVSSKTARLESLDSLRRRVEEASLHLSLDQLSISPQCGFASTVAGNPVTVEDEINKLSLLVRAAEEIWG
jgi:5-methyltetrahydropteroyltriglutamate--homocysteine methyltransferase